MALTRADCLIWEALADRNLIPTNPSLLEIGQANWYGDMPVSWLREQSQRRHPDRLAELDEAAQSGDSFRLSRLFYRCLLDVQRFAAIDLHPPDGSDAHRLDLNEPIDLGKRFEIVVNTGTLEHVFDQCRALQTIHEHCAVGGLMLHAGPLAGWPDHGLFHAQPGLWLDLARANAYDVIVLAYFDMRGGHVTAVDGLAELHRIPWADGSLLYAVLRKTADSQFCVPRQGIYSENPDANTVQDWHALR